jgi:hypothetical protein
VRSRQPTFARWHRVAGELAWHRRPVVNRAPISRGRIMSSTRGVAYLVRCVLWEPRGDVRWRCAVELRGF